jgi:dTDP-4-amino-4,6-dideoxygalactose transaminase
VGHGDNVLTNAFTLAPVPGAIASVGATPIFVGVTENLVIDFDDLEAKSQNAKVLMLSHMRGHICDMDRLLSICASNKIQLIEDCAHTMGAKWGDRWSGTDGVIGCYSTQTYKHINSGEGGLLVTNNPDIMAKATMLSGSYMLYDRHPAGPEKKHYDLIKYETPNISGRMDHLRASILRPQLDDLMERVAKWNELYQILEEGLRTTSGLTIVERPKSEKYVGSSFQFLLLDWPSEQIKRVVADCFSSGVELKWFGEASPRGFTSRYDSWKYVQTEPMAKTDRVLSGLLDLRLPLSFTKSDCTVIASIINNVVQKLFETSRTSEI